jgi:hypothetical protein
MSNPKYSSALSIEPLQREVRDRFGVLPNFFRLASETPDITRNLWGFRPIRLPRQPDAVAVQGVAVCLPVPVL